jgi:hypothetical protein
MFDSDRNQSQNRALAPYHVNRICHECLRNRRLNRSTVYGQKMEPEDLPSGAQWDRYSLTELPQVLYQEFVRGLRRSPVIDHCSWHFEWISRTAWSSKAWQKVSRARNSYFVRSVWKLFEYSVGLEASINPSKNPTYARPMHPRSHQPGGSSDCLVFGASSAEGD